MSQPEQLVMIKKGLVAWLGLNIFLSMLGCSSTSQPLPSGEEQSKDNRSVMVQNSVKNTALRLMEARRFKEANAEVNRALARDPENAELHLINGLAYYQQWLEGNRGVADLAEAAFSLALQFEPGTREANYYLGLLYLNLKKYDQARLKLIDAWHLYGDDNDVMLALATAAYFARDIPLASWAADKMAAANPKDPDALRAAAIVNAAAGNDSRVEAYLEQLRLVAGQGYFLQVKRRIEDWKLIYEDVRSTSKAAKPAALQTEVQYAQAGYPTAPYGSGPGMPIGQAGTENNGTGGNGPIARSWSDCVQNLTGQTTAFGATGSGWSGSFSGGFGSGGFSATDEMTVLPPLPSPCQNLPLPRMAIVDIVMLRTEETTSYAHGVNLLEGLKLVLGGNVTETRFNSNNQTNVTRTSTGSIGLPSSGISYALNIFNVGDGRSEVIARPSLLVLDRVGSSFFSGSAVSIGLIGQYGGTLQDKSIGIGMTVTPTFLDDENILLAIKVSRSFVEPVQFGSFGESLTTTKNSVTANAIIKMGETVILSGLRERQVVDSRSGVPVLRDIPIFQYLFGQNSESDYSKHIVLLVTPRKPTNIEATFSEAEKHRQEIERFGVHKSLPLGLAKGVDPRVGKYTENMTAIIGKLGLNRYYREFRNGDLTLRRFADERSFTRMIQDLRETLYY